MDYINNLRNLVKWQVENFIRNVMHPDDSACDYVENKKDSVGQKEYRSDNPNVPHNQLEWEFHARHNELKKKKPRDLSDSESYDGVKKLMPELDENGQVVSGSTATNDQSYSKNYLDALNTPFDHIDRILL